MLMYVNYHFRVMYILTLKANTKTLSKGVGSMLVSFYQRYTPTHMYTPYGSESTLWMPYKHVQVYRWSP